MNTRYSPLSTLLLVSLLVLLVTGQGLASGLVLCVGESGHSAFEQAAAGKCASAQTPCSAEGEWFCDSCTPDHCGPCQDFSASSNSLHGRWRGEQDLSVPIALPPPAVPAPSFALFLRDLTVSLSPLPPPQPYSALLALRTVVLLN